MDPSRGGNDIDVEKSKESESRSVAASQPNFLGKHRMTAAIALLNQQIQFIQEEVEQLEALGESSLVCKELVTSVESIPDALLPITRGPTEVAWERWFQRAHGSKNRKRWI